MSQENVEVVRQAEGDSSSVRSRPQAAPRGIGGRRALRSSAAGHLSRSRERAPVLRGLGRRMGRGAQRAD